MNNTPEINNNPDFTLCKNSAKALHSDATKWFLYTFLEQNLAHGASNLVYKAFNNLLINGKVNDEEVEMLALLVKDKSFKKKLIESGNKYIENNIVLPENLTDYETVLENQVSNKLSADKIIKILEFYLLKLKVNKYVQQTTENILLPEDLDTDSDVGKSGKLILETNDIFISKIGDNYKRIDKNNPNIIDEYDYLKIENRDNYEEKNNRKINIGFLAYFREERKDSPRPDVKNNNKNKKEEQIVNYYYKVGKQENFGLLDKKGKILLDTDFEEIIFYNTWARLKKDGKYGAFDLETNKQIIDCEYDEIDFNINYGFLVTKLEKKGVIDKKGNLVLEIDFKEIEFENKHFKTISEECLKSVYNMHGTQIYGNLEGDKIKVLDGDFIATTKDEKIGIRYPSRVNGIMNPNNVSGFELIPCNYKAIEYYPGIGFKVFDGKKYGVYNLDGKLIIPCEYKTIAYHVNTCFEVKKTQNKWGVFNLKGDVIFKARYELGQIKIWEGRHVTLERTLLPNITIKVEDLNNK